MTGSAPSSAADAPPPGPGSRLLSARAAPRSFSGRAGTVAALAVLGGMAAAAVLAPVLAPYDPVATDTSATALPPGAPGHPLGTDPLGRDLLSRMLYGARSSLAVGLLAGGATVALGTLAGALAAVGPRWLDTAVTRTADALLALPMILVALVLAAVAGPSGATVAAAIAVTGWMPVALITRAEVKAWQERAFVRAARALGLSPGAVLVRHLLPNALPPVAAVAAFEVGHAVLTESTLSFLGVGIPPNTPSWGNMLTDARALLLTGQWYTVALPVAAITAVIIAVNVVATGIERRGAGEGTTW